MESKSIVPVYSFVWTTFAIYSLAMLVFAFWALCVQEQNVEGENSRFTVVFPTLLSVRTFTVLALYVLRVREPELPRPYRATGYQCAGGQAAGAIAEDLKKL